MPGARLLCAAIKREEQERKREREHVIQTELVDDPVAPAEDDDHHNATVLPSDVSAVLISNGVFLLSTGCPQDALESLGRLFSTDLSLETAL